MTLASYISLVFRTDFFGQHSYLGGVLLEGGSDTTSSFLQSLILALVAFPEVQVKAQEELDRVVGNDRAPSLEDISKLPYIQAVINEVGLQHIRYFCHVNGWLGLLESSLSSYRALGSPACFYH